MLTAAPVLHLRVNSPLASIPESMTALGIKAAERMGRPESMRVRIW